ncbi:para-aminobenzoate synthetase [Rhodococcus sp. 27YEA15]|uniref:aminodeoxychorismate synthase component I n=1 Tax=Rhodococcus sp. 27YEA15 TaxID=3156259 RepID=UPI003C7B4545
MSARTLLVDNYDSFTYNLFTLLTEVNGAPPVVIRNDADWDALDLTVFDNVVISPGPGRPDRVRDFGISRRFVEEAPLPLLGVCLGHQGLCALFGADVDLAPEAMHGRPSQIEHDGSAIFAGIPSPFRAIRYHSLTVYRLPAELACNAWTADGLVMGVRHRSKPLWGVQFHPESISSEFGVQLLANFRDLSIGSEGRASTTNVDRPPARRRSPSEHYRVDVSSLDFAVDAAAAFAELFAGGPNSFWLDRSSASESHERLSVLGDSSGPLAEYVTYSVDSEALTVVRSDSTAETVQVPFFEYLNEQLTRRFVQAPEGVDFNLGYVGYLGYELKAQTGGTSAHSSPYPDAALVFADRAVVVDHHLGRTHVLTLHRLGHRDPHDTWTRNTLAALRRTGTGEPETTPSTLVGDDSWSRVRLRHDRDDYLRLIEEAKEDIRQGESYEICLTNMATVDGEFDALHTFAQLRRINPTPYSAFLDFTELSVVSASPERFLRVSTDGLVESKPIKGTRPRGLTLASDAALRQDLLDSEKERAENLMIVDLSRNDLAKVCIPGSVHVPRLFGIETYSSVHQMVSTIRGSLGAGTTAVDCVRAAFPGGSMTGAPKVRTMEIIDRLEAGPRGVYSGSIGYFALGGAADLSIVIRSLSCTKSGVSFGTGGAITALSDPSEEFEETVVKASSLLRALDDASAPAPSSVGTDPAPPLQRDPAT